MCEPNPGPLSTLHTMWQHGAKLVGFNIFNINDQLAVVEGEHACKTYENKIGDGVKPGFVFSGHHKEGFAIDWCTMT